MNSTELGQQNDQPLCTFRNDFDKTGIPPGNHITGSYWKDAVDPHYNMKWPNMDECVAWMEKECRTQHFDFVKSYINKNKYSKQQVFSCSSGETGGPRNYARKCPERAQTVPSRKVSFLAFY